MSSVKTAFFVLCLTLSASAQTYRFQDGGMTRTFVVEEQPASASAVEGAPIQEPQLILYEVGAKKTEYSKRIATKQVLIKLKPGTDLAAFAEKYNIVLADSPSYAPGFYVFETPTAFGALTLSETLRNDPEVLSAEPMLARKHKKKVIPNDPQFTNQWHLLNTGQNGGTAGIDINVTNVWETYQGTGIIVGVIDDGLEWTHEDLTNRVNSALGKDWVSGDNDPSPNLSAGDSHGTSCAGLIAAQANNAIGVSGVAPKSTLAGLRLVSDEANVDDGQEAAAFYHSNQVIHIKSNSWGPFDTGNLVEGPGTLAAAALQTGAETGRNGKGTVFVWAAGNGYQNDDNANYDGYANSIYTIAIGAVDDNGLSCSYSEAGAPVVVCAPSGDSYYGNQDITTTAVENGYRSNFDGTSAATPQIAGVVALMLEANPNLGWRDVQEILISTAWKSDPNTYAEWATNSAGFHFDYFYGAGLTDAEAAVNIAETWVNLGTHTNVSVVYSNLPINIPDNSTSGITNTFTITEAFRVEHAVLTANIAHTARGNLKIALTSPSGMESVLAEVHNDANDNYTDWSFSSVRHWGEDSAGTWTAHVSDETAGNTGTLNSLTLTLYGTHDSDSDLIDDTWEVENFGSITNANLTTDTDNDGSRDYDEWRTGTQPTNAASKLSIDIIQTGADEKIGWQSVAGKTYTVEISTNLMESFQPLETNLVATPPQNVLTNLPALRSAFYRIVLETD